MPLRHAILIAVLAPAIAPLWGEVIYSTGGGGEPEYGTSAANSLGDCGTDCASGYGFQFTLAAGGPYTFDGLVVPLDVFIGGSSATAEFDLYADASGSPGVLLDTLDVTDLTGVPEYYTLDSTENPVLQGGDAYWIVGTAAANVDINWFVVSPQVNENNRLLYLDGVPEVQFGAVSAFAILGAASTPEPSTFFLMAVSAFPGLLILRMSARRKRNLIG